jgi:hypothetical protein
MDIYEEELWEYERALKAQALQNAEGASSSVQTEKKA